MTVSPASPAEPNPQPVEIVQGDSPPGPAVGELLGSMPEDMLQIAASWLGNTSTIDNLNDLQKKLVQYRTKHEVFMVQMASSSAVRTAEFFTAFWQIILPAALSPARLKKYSNHQMLQLVETSHKILRQERAYQHKVLQTGPRDLPPLVPKNVLPIGPAAGSDKALGAFAGLKPKEREDVRSLLDSLINFTKGMPENGSNGGNGAGDAHGDEEDS